MTPIGLPSGIQLSKEFKKQLDLKYITIPLLEALNTHRNEVAHIQIPDFLRSPSPLTPDYDAHTTSLFTPPGANEANFDPENKDSPAKETHP